MGDYRNGLNEKQKLIDRFRNSEALDFESDDLKKELKFLNELKYFKGPNDWFSNLKTVIRENKEWVKDFKENNEGKSNLLLEVISYCEVIGLRGFIAILNEFLSNAYVMSYIFETFSMCGFLTDKPNQITRYPDINSRIYPVDYYNSSLNVVK